MAKEHRLSPRPKSPAGSGEDPWGSPSWDPPSARLSPDRIRNSPNYRSTSPTPNFEERYLASSSGWKDSGSRSPPRYSDEVLLRTPPTDGGTYARTSPTRYSSYDRESLLDKYGFEGREHVYQDRYGFDDPLPSYPERMDHLERYSPSRPSSPTYSQTYREELQSDLATSTMPSRLGSSRPRSPTASTSGWKETSTSRSLMPSRRRK